MKKLPALIVVLTVGTVSVAAAEVLYPTVVDVGMSGGRDGTSGNELEPSDIVGIEVWLTAINPSEQYGGYWIDGLDISLDVMSGPGNLDIDPAGVQPNPPSGRLYDAPYSVGAVVESPTKIAIDGRSTFHGWTPWEDMLDDGDMLLFYNFLFHCNGAGVVEIALNLDGPSFFFPYPGITIVNYTSSESDWWKYPGPNRYSPDGSNFRQLTPADLGSIVVNQIPEPLALGLLDLGGLVLRRRHGS